LQKDRKVAAAWIGWSVASAAVIALLFGSSYFLSPTENGGPIVAKDFSTKLNSENQITSYSNSMVDYR